MPTTTLYLVRHGEADENVDDDPGLTGLGRRQAEAVGSRLAGVSPALILHSTRRRAAETAAIIADRPGAPTPEPSPLARDLTPYPDDWALVPQRYHGWFDQVPTDERDPGGRRLDGAITGLGQVGAVDRSLVVVTHNFVIGWFVRDALDAPWWRWIGLNQANGGLAIIQWRDAQPPRLLAFNETGHLDSLGS